MAMVYVIIRGGGKLLESTVVKAELPVRKYLGFTSWLLPV
jgi:hypothetical protein